MEAREGWLGARGDLSIAGRTIEMNNRKVTVVGVTAAGFQGTEGFSATKIHSAVRFFWLRLGCFVQFVAGFCETWYRLQASDEHLLSSI